MTFQDSIKNNHACEGIVNISFKKGKRKSQSPSFLFKGKKKKKYKSHIYFVESALLTIQNQ